MPVPPPAHLLPHMLRQRACFPRRRCTPPRLEAAMSGPSSIEWTDATWNPVRGCSRVSPGCENCYAERHAARFSGEGLPFEGFALRKLKVIADDEQSVVPRWTVRVELQRSLLDVPLRWRRPRRIFVNSMSDLFHEGLTDQEIEEVFGIMAAAPQHTFQILTKRPGQMHAFMNMPGMGGAIEGRWRESYASAKSKPVSGVFAGWPLPHVWLGVSV